MDKNKLIAIITVLIAFVIVTITSCLVLGRLPHIKVGDIEIQAEALEQTTSEVQNMLDEIPIEP